nr:unnamed protein product [Spirometra erinaceieuropaei]
MFVTKFLSPVYFGRTSEVYRRLQPKDKGEWDSRCVSSLHAASVSVLSFISLVIDHDLWINPITTVSRVGCIALAISIGYMIAESETSASRSDTGSVWTQVVYGMLLDLVDPCTYVHP